MAKKTPSEKTIKVRAVEGYSNGTIPGAARWPGGEVREISLAAYRLLLTDNPTNFEVVEAPAADEPEQDHEPEPVEEPKKKQPRKKEQQAAPAPEESPAADTEQEQGAEE